MRVFHRSKPVPLLAAAAIVLSAGSAPRAQAPAAAPVVYSAEVDSIIQPVSEEFMIATMDQADRAGASLVVFTLRTPGGLVDATRAIISHMIAAKTPVAVWVGPAGGRAASAGFLLTIAADVAAMAPGTHIGAAHPVSGGGEQMDATMSKKVAEDLAAYARTLATQRHRNVQLAAAAVNDSRAFTDKEALDASLVNLIAPDVPTLLRDLDGRTITRFDGTAVVLKTAGARIVPVEMTLRQRVLSAIAHPNIAYLLLSLGTLGVTIELWSPGAILPGIAGGLCLLCAFFALQLLPVNTAGLLLLLFGLVLLALEIKVPSYGLLTAGGLVSLILGSMMLMDSPEPALRVSLDVVIPVVIGFTAVAAFLARLAFAAHRRRPTTGPTGMIDEVGEVLEAIAPDRPGQVLAHGEIWRAAAGGAIPAGARVRIVRVDGLMLTVERTEVLR